MEPVCDQNAAFEFAKQLALCCALSASFNLSVSAALELDNILGQAILTVCGLLYIPSKGLLLLYPLHGALPVLCLLTGWNYAMLSNKYNATQFISIN